ncbi:hypothetical protein P0136_13060 [Lentisphaerota bacterium ZTH]|nr:hypothetical protein JYG24_09425 [Lentisphaerota bacterium]WET06288.1 hypothetical protein P0136_13060 [Lentisphaerota bacterium ZTH]
MKRKTVLLLSFFLLLCFISQKLSSQVQGRDAFDISAGSLVTYDITYAKQWSLPPVWFLKRPVSNNFPLLTEVPAVGVYTRYGYNFRQRLLIVNMSEHALELAPRHMRQSITPGVTQFQNIGEVLANGNLTVHICAVITGKGSHPDQTSMIGKEFNISFHGFALKHYPEEVKRIVHVLPVGMFVPLGIVSASNSSIPMGRLGTILVTCYFNDQAPVIGPNTSRFKTVAAVSSFWTAAKMGHRGEDIIVTYHLLLNTSRVSDAVRRVLESTTDYFDILRAIRAVPNTLNLDDFSSYVLRDWVDNVAHISRPF